MSDKDFIDKAVACFGSGVIVSYLPDGVDEDFAPEDVEDAREVLAELSERRE